MRKPELRPNNTVGMKLDVFPHNIFTVTEVGDTMKVWDGADSHFFDVDDLQGVPLTKEWLKKFGFMPAKDQYGGYLKELSAHEGSIRIRHNSICLEWFSGVNHVRLDFVHQLQNLYYALTGEDLIVKP